MKRTESEVAIIGAGLAGLTAATYLARAGRRVTVYEKSPAPGGRARTQHVEGFDFNLGAHALYKGEAAAILSELGVTYSGGEPRSSGGYALRAKRLHTLPTGFVSLLTSGLLRGTEKLEAARFLASLRGIETARFQSVTVADWLEDYFDSPAVREFVHAYIRVATYTDEPAALSAGAALDQLKRALDGVVYLDGGWQTLVNGLRTAAETAGAKIITGAEAIRVNSGSIAFEDGATAHTGAVLIAGSPQMAADLTQVPALAGWAAAARPVRASSLDVALSGLTLPKALVAFGIDQPLYLSVHSAVAKLAPGGGAMIHVMRYGGLRGAPLPTVKQQLIGFLEQVQPGWRNKLVRMRFVPQMVVSNAIASAAAGGLAGRPGPSVPGLPGVYVAGDWVGPRGMLADASLSSAKQAAGTILAGAVRAEQAA